MFTHGVWPPYDPDDVSQLHQLHVNIERIRVPEAMFQPSIIGLDQAGLVETVSNVVSRFKEEEMKTMVQVWISYSVLFNIANSARFLSS